MAVEYLARPMTVREYRKHLESIKAPPDLIERLLAIHRKQLRAARRKGKGANRGDA